MHAETQRLFDECGATDGEVSERVLRRVAKATFRRGHEDACGDCAFCTSRGDDHPYCELTDRGVDPDQDGCDVGDWP